MEVARKVGDGGGGGGGGGGCGVVSDGGGGQSVNASPASLPVGCSRPMVQAIRTALVR